LSLARNVGVTLFTPKHECKNLRKDSSPTGVVKAQAVATGGKLTDSQWKPLRNSAIAD
jgi:hypothetical protein